MATDTETWYFQIGISSDYVTPADGGGIPAVAKAVLDDGPDDTRSGVDGVRVIAPQASISDRGKIRTQHAPVLAAAPYARPGAPGRA